jgi:ankyrin repeat protein
MILQIWFQNRRAKAKQEKKPGAYEACQAQASFPRMGRTPLSALPYNYQYISPSGASMESLHEKIAAAQDPLNVGLLVAARFRLPKLLKLELEMGANVNFASSEALLTPLIWAAMSNNCEAVELLLQYGADPHLVNRSGNAPLAYAVANGHNDVVKVLRDDHTKTEEISMDVSISTPCDTCKAAETMYKVSL